MLKSKRILARMAGILGIVATFLVPATAQAESPAAAPLPGRPALHLGTYDIGQLGYTTEEFSISGTATSYKLANPPTGDGRWEAVPAATAPYATRIVVVRPTDRQKFNGTVVVEWLNVSAGADGAPDWNVMHRELVRSGFAYVGVSAQKVGVEGGPSQGIAVMPLKKADPARYGRLSHPGDAFAYDIFSQAGALLRQAHDSGVLGPLVPRRIIAVGESQSAVFLTTYVNAVDPLARVFDGFMLNSRFGLAAAIDGRSMFESAASLPPVVRMRPDLRTPVMTVITETDLLMERPPGFIAARQPDNDKLRIWEIAGASHADSYFFHVGHMDSGSIPLEKLAAAYAPSTKAPGGDLAKPMNPGFQHHYVLKAALVSLDRWLRTGQPATKAPRLEVSDTTGAPSLALDDNGLARGGIRTPWVDAPTARMSGFGNSGGPLAFLAGVGEPFDAATLARLYPGGKREYLTRFESSLAAAIDSGYILPADRQEILGLAEIGYSGSR